MDETVTRAQGLRLEGYSEAAATRDCGELFDCHLFIIDTLDDSNTGGREVEYGLAVGAGKEVWRVGPVRNIFHLSARAFSSWDQALLALGCPPLEVK